MTVTEMPAPTAYDVVVPPADGFANTVGLSERETTILSLVASGRSNDQIGRSLFLSTNTIKTYIRSAYRRMGVTTRTEAVIWAFDHGLVTPARDAARAGVGEVA